MIFVVGIPRSGTTWVSSLLAEHPECERLTADVLGWTMPKPTLETDLFLRGLSDSEIRDLVPPNEKRWVEKTPKHLLYIEDIRRVFPEAQIVEVIRRPSDVVRSMVNATHWDARPRSIEEAWRVWERYSTAGSVDVWIKYETLWRDPVAETERLYGELGLDPAFAEEAVERTRYGRNLPLELKGAFQGGQPSEHL